MISVAKRLCRKWILLSDQTGELLVALSVPDIVDRAGQNHRDAVASVRKGFFKGNRIGNTAVIIRRFFDEIGLAENRQCAGCHENIVLILRYILLGKVDRLSGQGVGGNNIQQNRGLLNLRIIQRILTV